MNGIHEVTGSTPVWSTILRLREFEAVAAPRGAKGFDYYSLKDRAMAETAAYGLMLGDGKSKRTVSELHLNDVPQRTAG